MSTQTFRIALTTKDGDLYHSSLVATEKIKETNTIVHTDPQGNARHFGFSRLETSSHRAILHFQEVSPPTPLDDLLKGF